MAKPSPNALPPRCLANREPNVALARDDLFDAGIFSPQVTVRREISFFYASSLRLAELHPSRESDRALGTPDSLTDRVWH